MSEHETLGKVIANDHFPVADYKLRRGVHVSIEDVELYEFIKIHVTELTKFYSRYDAELKEGAEGYFYLTSNGTIFGQRQLSKAEMLVGLAIAHLYRDPEYRIRSTGALTLEQVLSRLETLKSQEDLARILTDMKLKGELHPSRVRESVATAVRTLASLNFLQYSANTENAFRCKRPIHRFDQFVAKTGSPELVSAAESQP